MTNEEIKAACEMYYEQITDANDNLKKLRAACNHEETFEGQYAYRVGSIFPAVICSICGSIRGYPHPKVKTT